MHRGISTTIDMNKLPISIGILGWNSNNSSLPNTLFSYLRNEFLDISDDITIFFQEMKEEDIGVVQPGWYLRNGKFVPPEER